MGKSDNASEFLDLYRKLEGCIREHYDMPEKHGPVAWLGLAETPAGHSRTLPGLSNIARKFATCSRTRRVSMAITPSSRATRC